MIIVTGTPPCSNTILNDKKFYGAIIKSYNKQGEPKYEMYQAIGLLHLNTEKRSERTPDMGGKVTIATGEEKIYKLGCWNRETSEGVPFTSLGFEEVQEEKEYSEKEIADKIGF